MIKEIRNCAKKIEKLKKEISNRHNKYLKKLYEEKSKLENEIEKKKNERLIGKTFVYKNNHFLCPSKKSDHWDIYLLVIGSNDSGLICLVCEKDSYGSISIRTENMSCGLGGYAPCKNKDFKKYITKLTNELNKNWIDKWN